VGVGALDQLAKCRQLLAAGQAAEAERLLGSLVKSSAERSQALLLLAAAYAAQGKGSLAEQSLRDLSFREPQNASAWMALGNLMHGQGRFADAVTAFRHALAANRADVAAWLGLARSLAKSGDVCAADEALEQAQLLAPRDTAILIRRASLAASESKTDVVLSLLNQAIAIEPNNAVALHNLGMNLAQSGDGLAARPLVEKAVSLRPERADMRVSLGFVYQLNRVHDLALASYRQAIRQSPLQVSAYDNLSRLLWQLGLRDEYLVDLDEALRRYPNAPALHITRAKLLALAQRYGEAYEAFLRAAQFQPENVIVLDGLARMAAELKQVDESIGFHERAIAGDRLLAHTRTSFAHSLLRFGQYARAKDLLEQALVLRENDQLALGLLTLAYRALEDSREAWLAGYEVFPRSVEVQPPHGYSDLATFNKDLAEALDALHDTECEPVDQSLRNGTQTVGQLFGRGIDLVDRLRERLDRAVLEYIRALPGDPHHPFLRRKSERFSYRGSWSSRLLTGGRHVSHVHSQGWISSAYYIALPFAVGDASAKQGWFTLGAPPFEMPWISSVRRYIQPREGCLILFPSYLYHGTVPFEGVSNRLTLAFDAAPC
jgi:tetratricopeptide (TPR) repeat protein